MKNRPLKPAESSHNISNSGAPDLHFPKLTLAHVSLILLGAMFVLPFLYYLHAHPRTTFYQEWGAAFLGLCAITLLLLRRFWVQPELPRIALLPMGLMLLVAVQYVLGLVTYLDQALLYSLYLLWAALLIMLGQRLRAELGLPVLATVLAACLLLGAELNALLGVLQHYRWHTFLDPVVIVKISAAVYGNLAQPNHYANYITLGLISLGLLRMRWGLRAWQVALLALPLLFVLVLSGSRSAGLYLVGMVGLAWLWHRRDKSNLPLLQYSAALIVGFGLMHFVVQIPALAGADGTVTTMQRLLGEDVGSGQLRLHLWREGWLIFTQFPLLGAGFGQFGWQHFVLTEQLRDVNVAGLYNNAHNLFIQTAAEMGLAGLLVLLATLVLWLVQAMRARERNVYHWWAYSVLAVLGIHSLLEYPLWYAYFLGIAALLLGMLDYTTYRLQLHRWGRLLLATMLLLGLLSLHQMWQGNRKMEGVLALRPASAADTENHQQRMREGILDVNKLGLMVSLAELYRANMMEISADNLADKLELNGRVMRSAPIGSVVYRQALLLALSGEQTAAELQMRRAIWAYPANFESERRKLSELALKDPAHFAALLEFALEKHKERQRAVHDR